MQRLALNLAGFAISIPVFYGAGVHCSEPALHDHFQVYKAGVIGYTTALVVGLMVTHCLVIPTPGPLAVGGSLGVNMGWFILYALLVQHSRQSYRRLAVR